MKRKTLTLVLCLLTVMSLVGVGFASWVISADTTKNVSGNIVVDTVADQRLVITVNTESQNIVFAGKEKDYAFPSKAWLTLGGDDKTETLSVTYACSVTYKDSTIPFEVSKIEEKNIVGITVGAEFAATGTTEAYETAITAGCFEEPNQEAVITGLTLSNDKTTLTFNVTITYSWGDAFGNLNPFKYYNTKNVGDKCGAVDGTVLNENSTWGDHASYYLGLLEAIDNSASYSITINVNVSETGSEVVLAS